MDEREEFFKIYGNLPIEERDNIVAVIDKEPISWKVAYLEIKRNTKLGKEILKTLKTLEIL
jgi:hypothetical protein